MAIVTVKSRSAAARSIAQSHGYCVGTDQIINNAMSDGKYFEDAKSFAGSATLTTGTREAWQSTTLDQQNMILYNSDNEALVQEAENSVFNGRRSVGVCAAGGGHGYRPRTTSQHLLAWIWIVGVGEAPQLRHARPTDQASAPARAPSKPVSASSIEVTPTGRNGCPPCLACRADVIRRPRGADRANRPSPSLLPTDA